jgi:hypothetical protein
MDTWLREHEKAGRTTSGARARFVGTDRSFVHRIENGSTLPGNKFIAAVKLAFPRRTLDYFFEALVEEVEE